MTKTRILLIMKSKKRLVIHVLYKKNKKLIGEKLKIIWVKTRAFQKVISHKTYVKKNLRSDKAAVERGLKQVACSYY